jgi:homoaconitase
MRNMPRFSAKGKPTGSFRETKPSGLSQQFNAVDDDSEEEVDEDDWEAQELRRKAEREAEREAMDDEFYRSAGLSMRHDTELEMAINAELEAEEEEEDAEGEYDYDEYGEGESYDDEEEEEQEVTKPRTTDFDMFLNMRHDDRPYGQPIIGEESDLAMLNEPAAVDRVRQEAESIFRRSSVQLRGSRRGQEFHFATIARDLYKQQDTAQLTEPPELILKTEELVCRLYDEGVGPDDDQEKMDNSLANIAARLLMLWRRHVDELPQPEGEDLATIGPGEQEEPLVKATWVAGLLLRMHHTRDDDDAQPAPLPEILFDWMDKGGHNLQPDQVRLLSQYRPSPASHSLYWQVLRSTLLRGDATSAARLLRNAGWEHVRKGPRGEKAYTGKALDSVRRFASVTADVLDQCPATKGEWDIWNSNWTLFRIKAKAELDRMALFAEGKDQGPDDSMDEYSAEGQSMSTMVKKASSQLPWDVYENLQTVYGIICGKEDAIMDTAQDWCEATIGLFGWWDDGSQGSRPSRLRASLSLRASTTMGSSGDYFERLSAAFHLVIQSDLNPNAMNPIEVALASVFEGNINAVIGFLRTWSLPIACSVAEIASLGGWLPPPEAAPLPLGTLDAEDLALLGVSQPAEDEIEGIKDATLVLYARELAGIENLSPDRNGWEMAIQVLGRMDLPEKSEETVGELLRDLLATLDIHSGHVVDKMWRILNDLGMINFAEETAEVSNLTT